MPKRNRSYALHVIRTVGHKEIFRSKSMAKILDKLQEKWPACRLLTIDGSCTDILYDGIRIGSIYTHQRREKRQ